MRPHLALSLLLTVLGCNRPEEPQSSPSVVTSGEKDGSDAAAEASDNAGRCVVPTPDEPSPTADPAGMCPADPEDAGALPLGKITFVDVPGQPSVAVELTRTEAERSRGLMYRTEMPADHGMLFSWNDERVRSFWMHNTCIPLDMLFIAADGLIVGILEQVPTLNDRSRSVPCPAAHVLELNAGWTRRHGVKAGQRVAIER